jgi:hypothetical protein
VEKKREQKTFVATVAAKLKGGLRFCFLAHCKISSNSFHETKIDENLSLCFEGGDSFQQTGCKKNLIIVIFLKKNELYEKQPMQVRVLGPDKGCRFYIFKVTCMKSEVAN